MSWSIKDRSTVFRTRRWAVERSLRRRAGQHKDHEFHTILIADFVNVIALTERDELVMVRQFRHGVERPTLEMPGGLVDPEETDVAAAARRELVEETGYDGDLVPLGTVYPNPALLNNVCHFFAAPSVARSASQNLEETEDAEVVLVPRERVNALISGGEIANALMIAGLKRFELWESGDGVF